MRLLSSVRPITIALAVYGATCCAVTSASATEWSVAPAYESPSRDTSFKITDTDGNVRELYSASNAVLIMEGAYKNATWSSVVQQAHDNEENLRVALEQRGFRVLVWRNLDSDGLFKTIEDIRNNLGFTRESRLFVYYFGHGKKIGQEGEEQPPQTFLVPVDAPNPVKDEALFYKVAFPINRLIELAREIQVRHAFFALEACQAGNIVSGLGDISPNKAGWILSAGILNSSRELLTAGSAGDDVPATGLFSQLLVDGMSSADASKDNYVTGSEMMSFVLNTLPDRDPNQKPDHAELIKNSGDFIFGRINQQVPVVPADNPLPKVDPGIQIDLPSEVASQLVVVIHVRGKEQIERANTVKAALAKYGILTRAIVASDNVNSSNPDQVNVVRFYNAGDLRGANAIRDILRSTFGVTTQMEEPRDVLGEHGLVEYWL